MPFSKWSTAPCARTVVGAPVTKRLVRGVFFFFFVCVCVCVCVCVFVCVCVCVYVCVCFALAFLLTDHLQADV